MANFGRRDSSFSRKSIDAALIKKLTTDSESNISSIDESKLITKPSDTLEESKVSFYKKKSQFQFNVTDASEKNLHITSNKQNISKCLLTKMMIKTVNRGDLL